jgi:hypothetical protein
MPKSVILIENIPATTKQPMTMMNSNNKRDDNNSRRKDNNTTKETGRGNSNGQGAEKA